MLRAVGTPHRVESWTWPTDYNPGPFIRVDEVFTFERAETVIAMIRDQADWLAAQGATT